MAGNGVSSAVPRVFAMILRARLPLSRRGLALAPAVAAFAWLSLSAAQQPQQPPPAQPAGQQGKPAPPQTGTPTQGQTQGDPAQPPVFRTGINSIRVDVLVTDNKGNPVTDLKQSDFEVVEDNKPQTIESFKLINVTGRPENGETPREIRSDYVLEAEAQREDVRLFVILLDDYHVRRGASMSVREPLTRFIRNQLGDLDLIGVAYPLTPFKDIAFTRNREAVIRAIERFDGRKYDYQPRNEIEEQYIYYPVETVERIRNQVSLSAIRSIAAGLGTLREGRKSLILVSEGYTNYVPPQLRDPSAAYPGMGNANRRNPMAGENNMNEDRARFFSNTDLLSDMREVFNEANRANVAIYAVDPRGLAAFEFDINEGVGQQVDRASLDNTLDSLRTLAEETDGRAIVNRNDLDVGMKQMMRDSSAYYLLGYNSNQAPQDGKFHQIRVKVKRQNTQVRARKGYWALSAEETARALAPPKPAADPVYGKALADIETPNRARVVRTWIGTTRAENGKTNVTLVWEPATRVPGDRRPTPTGVSVMAQGAGGFFRGKAVEGSNGAVASGAGASGAGGGATGGTNASGGAGGSGVVVIDSTAPRANSGTGAGGSVAATNGASATSPGGAPGALARGGRLTFPAAPGPLQLKLSIEGAAGQVLDSDFRDLVVPDYTKAEASLSEPAVFRARTQRDMAALSSDPQAMPTTAREFSRTERLLIRVAAYAPGGSVTLPAAQLLNRDGKKMSDLVVKPFTPGGEGMYQTELPLAGLPAGEFIIQVTMGGEGGEQKRLVGLRVTS
jgi:VWFA-related protein